MQKDSGNIYKTARQTAGLTQERWAEMLGLSVEAVRQYETGKILPSDPVVQRMSEISMLPALAYWHLCRKSQIAEELLPQVERLPLPQATVQLLAAIRAFANVHREDRLLDIAADGRVDELEAREFKIILEQLSVVVKAALQLKFAEEAPREEDP